MDLDFNQVNFGAEAELNNIEVEKSGEPRLYDTLEDFFNYNYNGNWSFVKYQGRTSMITGGRVTGVGTSEESLLGFGHIIGQYFQVPYEQLPQIMLVSTTSKARHYYIPQVIDGLQVYNSGIQLSVDLESNSIFQIGSTLRNPQNIDESIHVDQIHAWEIITSSFKESVIKLDSPYKPVIYSDYAVSGAELAWVFKIKVHSQIDQQRTVVIGAATGFILVNSKLVIH